MKKILWVAMVTIGWSNFLLAQGEVQIVNSAALGTKIYTNYVGSATGQVGALMPDYTTLGFTFLLFYNTTTNSGVGAPNISGSITPWQGGGWVNSGAYATNSFLAGRIIEEDGGAGYVVLPTSASSAVGVYANLEMIGWNTAVGGATLTSFIQAYDSGAAGLFYGNSSVANILLGNNASPINSNLFFLSEGGVNGFTLGLVPLPEPASMVLAGLGGLSLLALRRKK